MKRAWNHFDCGHSPDAFFLSVSVPVPRKTGLEIGPRRVGPTRCGGGDGGKVAHRQRF